MYSANELIRAIWAREPRPAQDVRARMGVWQILTDLLRDGGLLNLRESPKSWRWLALALTLLYQGLWCIVLIWLMYVRFWIIPWAPPEASAPSETAIEVTFIDESRPPAAQNLPTPLAEPRPQPLPRPLPEPPPVQVPPSPRPEPRPAPPTPLMLTEVTEADSDFTLQAPSVQRPNTPPLPRRPPPAPERALQVVDVPLLQRPDRRLPAPTASLPPTRINPPERALPQREIPAPLPEIELRPLQPPRTTTVDLPEHTREMTEREIPGPLPDIELRPSARSTASLPSPTVSAHAREIREREIALVPPTPADNGVREIDLTPPSASDAWERPARPTNTASGLLDAEGRPRLADSRGRAGGGLPPGTIVEDYANIDRMGTWLKRPSPGYQPSQLDQLWVPHEDILQEWVRRSIKNILIPIPGTGKTINCTVVLLMLGGGCGITDPNLLDIEASSRPPPDIPFKPELHEDQDSLTRPAHPH